MDLLILALEQDLDQTQFNEKIAQVLRRLWLDKPCGLLLNHPLALNNRSWKDVLCAFPVTTEPSPESLAGVEAWEQLGIVRQLAPACVCCTQQGQLGLVLAGMYRALKAFRANKQADPADLSVLLVSTPQISQHRLLRGLRYLQPPVRVVSISVETLAN